MVRAWCVHGVTLPADPVTKIDRNAGSLELLIFFAFSNVMEENTSHVTNYVYYIYLLLHYRRGYFGQCVCIFVMLAYPLTDASVA